MSVLPPAPCHEPQHKAHWIRQASGVKTWTLNRKPKPETLNPKP